MPALARRLAHRYLPQRVRAAGLALLRPPKRPPRPKPAAKKTPRAAAPAPQQEAGNVIVSHLRRGASLSEAMVAETRALIADGSRGLAISVAGALEADPNTRTIGLLNRGIAAATAGYDVLAWSLLRELPDESWATHAAGEFVRTGLVVEPEAALRRVRDLVSATPASTLPARCWLDMLGPVFGYGDQELARSLFRALDSAVGDGSGVDNAVTINRDWLRPWVAATPDAPSAPEVAAGSIPFAIIDYGHPHRARASRNIGDHIQSLASLGHLARQQALTYTGSQDLVDLMSQLRERTRTELQRTNARATVELIRIDRDVSSYAAIPPRTWTLAFGWYMQSIFGVRYGFPLHPNLLPVFISFHCNRRGMLTEESIEYLRRFAPIGCRDWTTVDVLLSVGVPAFFSGCLTTTVNTVFPDTLEKPGSDASIAYVDMPGRAVPHGAPTYGHGREVIRSQSFAANVYDAIELLETYRRKHRGILTSRLHCYLPVRSLGVPVDFQPQNRSDTRFAGLIDITDAEFLQIQAGINHKLEQVLNAILEGAPSEDVYALWRRLTADDVAAAERRRAKADPLPPMKQDLVAAAAAVRATLDVADVPDATVEVAVWVGAKVRATLEVLLASVVAGASRPVRFWLLTRDPDSLDRAALERRVPGTAITVVSTRGLGGQLQGGDGRVPSPRDLDLLVLPEIVGAASRLVVLPPQAVVLGDVTELADVDLQGNLFAAAGSLGWDPSGFRVLHGAASRLGPRTAASTELRRRAHQRHRFDFDAFDIQVLVLDAGAWRERAIVATYVPFIEEFGLRLREVLHLEAGPNRAELPRRWALVPTRSPLEDPALVHWADDPRPWSGDVAPAEEVWLAAQALLAR